jgi:hypothetical protein
MQDACHTYAVRVYVRRSDGGVYAYGWDDCESLSHVIEEIEESASIIDQEKEDPWIFEEDWYYPEWITHGTQKDRVLDEGREQ